MSIGTAHSNVHHRSMTLWPVAALLTLLAVLALGAPRGATAQSEQRCFQETGFCIGGRIRGFWEQNGGLPVFGLSIAPQQEEIVEGQRLQVQWFERARLELHPGKARPYDVVIGRVGAQRLGQQGRDWFQFPKSAPQNGCRFFPETGHNACGAILAAWHASGLELDGRAGKSEAESLALFGLPLSDMHTESIGGKEYQVQWFERSRFELHSENALAGVQLGLLGSEIQAGPHGTVWVTNRTTNDVTAYNAGTGVALATIPVGQVPIGVIAPTGRDKVYVSNEGSNTVSVISKKSMSVVATIATGPRPHHIGASPNGKLVYVAEFGTNRVGVIDTDLDQLVAEFVTGAPTARTHAVWLTQDGKTLLVTNSVVNQIAALDALTGQIKWSLPVGNNPSEVLVTADDKTAYVSIRNENKVQVVDLARLAVIAETEVGQQPDTLQLTPDGRTLVVTLRGTPAHVAIVDVASGLAVTPVNIAGATTGHHWLSANGRYSLVAVEGPGSVAVIDNWAPAVVATYAYPGGGRPHGVFYEPALIGQ
jgi:YVTN family beta-propeller protein